MRATSVDEGTLGLALLCIGAGALVSMRPAGPCSTARARVLPVAVAIFGACASSRRSRRRPMAVALLALGAASGAVDVAINAEGVRAEAASGQPLMSLAHAAFSATVVVASLLAGALRAADAGVVAIFAAVAALVVLAALALARLPAAEGRATGAAGGGLRAMLHVPRGSRSSAASPRSRTSSRTPGRAGAPCTSRRRSAPPRRSRPRARRSSPRAPRPGACSARRRRGASRTARSSAPARRWRRPARCSRRLAPATGIALAGIALAGLGTSVCAPLLIGIAGARATAAERASAVSIVTTIAYLGFLVGPAAVGLAADALSLPAALAGVAGLALVLAALVRLAPRR